MSTSNVYRVVYHWEIGGKKVGDNSYQDHVIAAASDYSTIRTVLVTNQGRNYPNATLVVDNVANIGPGNVLQ